MWEQNPNILVKQGVNDNRQAHGVLKLGRKKQRSQNQSDGDGRLDPPLLPEKVEGGTASRGVWAASGSRRRQEKGFSLKASRKEHTAQVTPWFQPVRLILHF